MLGHFFLPFNIRKEKIIQKRTILKRIIAAVLFIAVAFVDMTATNAATARRVAQPQTTTTTNRTITPRTTTARTTTKRTTAKNTSTAKTTTTTAQRVANRTVPTTKASTEQPKTNVVSRTATNKNAGATRRYTQSSTQSRTITRATTLTGTVGAKSGAVGGLVKMYVPDDLRLSDENIKKYVELSSSGDGNNYILFKLYNNQLPSLATMFNRIKVQHNGNTYGVYAENSTTSNNIVNTSGTQTATSVPNSMYLVQSQSTTGDTCSKDSDCGAGTCNSGTCQCFLNHTTQSGNFCACETGYALSGGQCVNAAENDSTNIITCTGASDEIVVSGNNCVKSKFEITTVNNVAFSDEDTIAFNITAIGTFYVDWGDETQPGTQIIVSNTLDTTKYQHKYSGEKSRKIRIGGGATGGYSDTKAVMEFCYYGLAQDYVQKLSGSIGALFPIRAGATNPIPKFNGTFAYCNQLTTVPATLFSGINVTTPSMFENTFKQCINLNNIPSGLFGDISDTPKQDLFKSTFDGCKKLTSVPAGLFSGIQGAPAKELFYETFKGCSSLTSIPDNLFSGIQGAPADQMFYGTFDSCSSLTAIPNNLFSGIQGKPAAAMFNRTFAACSSLTSIPANLFSGISGAPAASMFHGTFSSCSNIQSLPTGLFSGIVGPTAIRIYDSTFSGCKGLTGNIPDDFFGKLYGVPSSYMFQNTFTNCSNLTGDVPSSMYKNLQEYPVSPGYPGPTNTYSQAFYGCTNMATSCENGTYEDPASAPFKSEWDGHVACTDGSVAEMPECAENQFVADDTCVDSKFAVTTTNNTRHFAFTIGAKGLIFVDWGDGVTEVLGQPDAIEKTYSHDYTTAGEYTIRFSAAPSDYPNPYSKSIIRFGYSGNEDDARAETPANVKSVSGSLGELFPNIDGASHEPAFIRTFSDCSNLESIPAGLFSGITKPTPYMFSGTFKNCTKLTSIPSTLFAGISGTPTKYLFSNTFAGCTGITSIPETLFSTITGELSEGLFAGTFEGCSGLTGQIPNNLFSSLSGPDNRSFQNMFKDCTGLSGYVPTSFYINKDLYAGSSSSSVFENTGLATECASPLVLDPRAPQNYNGNPYWDYKVACNYPCTSDKIDAHKDGLECYDPEFEIVTTDDTTELKFVLTATGTFYVDCGDDGTLSRRNTGSGASVTGNTITQQTSVVSVYTCSYPTAGRHTIRMAGEATGYTDNDSVGLSYEEPAAITFYHADYAPTSQNITEIRGSLATIFPEVGSRSDITECPRFHGTFRNAQIKTIPEGLFDGLSGCGQYTFYYTFANNEQLESIPAGLFSSITNGVKNMFDSTFRGCTKLTSIPSNLFSNLHSVDQRIFESTFAGCTGLTALPVGLFQNITTAAPYMFWNTFNGCSNMGSYIPSTAFKGLTDNNCPTESNMWTGTFNNTSMSTMFCPQGTTKYTSCYSDGKFGNWISCEEGGSTGGDEDPQLFTCTGATDEIVVSGTQCVKAALVVTTKEQNSFKFDISAGGTFYVDWGDGNVETIDRSGTTSLNTVSHNYTTAAKRTVRFGGVANAYSTIQTHPAIRFYSGDGCDIYGIDQSSSLGAMFPIIASGGNGNTPRFYETFRNCIDKNNTSAGTNGTALIPAGLFSGINGAPVSYMFYDTFAGSNFRDPSSGPTIPSGLFSGITGAPAEHLFDGTFRNIEYMSGNIPADLFAGIQGTPAPYMFARTFAYAGGAWENRDFRIDSALFGFITGTPAKGMFESTFEGSWLTNLPIGLFANISGAPAIDMFDSTFKECTHISGATLSNTTFGNISGTVATGMFKNTFKNITGITGSIPNKLFGTLTGAPAQDMFAGTFEGCTGITGAIPSGLFGSISGNIQWPMAFNSTFYNTSITSIPEDLFSGITGTDFEHSFTYTFAGTKITSIPENLFAGITGTYESMFTGTFMNCENLTTVPAGLFNRITGTPKPLMFDETFAGCTSLQQVPYNLFGGISGAPVNKIFPATFKDSGLTSIDNRLFSGITGTPATNIFYETFSGCTGLTALPTELFKNISGTPADSMFHSTFEDCSNITGSIPNDLFGPVSGNPAAGMFAWTFIRCSSLTGEVPTNMFVGLNHDYTMPENTSPFTNAFYKTGMPAQCPEGYKLHPYAAKYRTYWDGRVACVVDENGGGSGGGETTNECTTNSDCGAGTCDSGTCQCFTNAIIVNGQCVCEDDHEQTSTSCIACPDNGNMGEAIPGGARNCTIAYHSTEGSACEEVYENCIYYCEEGYHQQGDACVATECEADSDCGAGICNSSMCECFENTNKINGQCVCKDDYEQTDVSCTACSDSEWYYDDIPGGVKECEHAYHSSGGSVCEELVTGNCNIYCNDGYHEENGECVQ
ncbi:MAG: hypothetical protein J6Y49_01610 [Alphaproteobacteria bacterium]|nr:hypothetical protein [Alphaproteobacteria bacterium]